MNFDKAIHNQWILIKSIYLEKEKTWKNLKEEIEELVDMERLKINPNYFDKHDH